MKVQQLKAYEKKLPVTDGINRKDQTFQEVIEVAQQQNRPLIFTVISGAWIKAKTLRNDWGDKNNGILKGCTAQAQAFKAFLDDYAGNQKPLIYILTTDEIIDAKQWLHDKEIVDKENINIISINEEIVNLLGVSFEQFNDEDIVRPHRASFLLMPNKDEFESISIERERLVTDLSVNHEIMRNHTHSIGNLIKSLSPDQPIEQGARQDESQYNNNIPVPIFM